MNSLIVYQSKYGATTQYAKWLAEELKLPAVSSEDCSLTELQEGGVLILGSSVYIGKLQLSRWLKQNEEQLAKYQLFLFVVSGTPLNETAKLFKYVKDSVPSSLFKQFRLFFLPGRLIYDRLSWKDRLMLRMGALLAGKKEGARMMAGYNDVKREHLQELICHVNPVLTSPGISHNTMTS